MFNTSEHLGLTTLPRTFPGSTWAAHVVSSCLGLIPGPWIVCASYKYIYIYICSGFPSVTSRLPFLCPSPPRLCPPPAQSSQILIYVLLALGASLYVCGDFSHTKPKSCHCLLKVTIFLTRKIPSSSGYTQEQGDNLTGTRIKWVLDAPGTAGSSRLVLAAEQKVRKKNAHASVLI